MFINYLRFTLRHLTRQRSAAWINVAGLAVGMAAFLLIFLFIRDEWRYEYFHERSDRIYRLSPPDYARTAPKLAPTVQAELAEVEGAIRLMRYNGLVKREDQQYIERNFAFAAPDILNMFSFRFVEGGKGQPLHQPNQVIIDQQTAKRYFNTTRVVGEQLFFSDTVPLTITGVFRDWPSNSHLPLNMVASFETFENRGPQLDTWSNNIYYTYVMLSPEAEVGVFQQKLSAFTDKHIRSLPNRESYELAAQNIREIHLHSQKDMEWTANGNINAVYIFAVLAFMVLLIACINFVNLSTALATKRAREIGVRKTVGARTPQLVRQFLFEALVVSVIALVLAVVLVRLGLPFINQVADKSLSLTSLFQGWMLAGLVVFPFLIALLAGAYPALVLSSFRPQEIFQNRSGTAGPGTGIRKVLVLVQFALSLLLISGGLVVYQQLHYMKNKALGFDKEQVLVLPYSWDGQVQRKYELLKEQWLQNPDILAVTQSGDIPGRMATRMGYWAEGMPEDESRGIQALYVDRDFPEVYGLGILAGRAFDNEIRSDLEAGFLLNEQAVAALGWTPASAIGKKFESHVEGQVIGVVKDFHYNALQQPVQPLYLAMRPDWAGYISLRVRTQQVDRLLTEVQSTWSALVPDRPFHHVFLDEDYNRQYLAETRLGKIVGAFTFLALFIACIGLFGLTTFTVAQRNKEIAVRKVLGASVPQLAGLLTREFTLPILGAVLLSAPIAFLAGRRWLDRFAYSVEINPLWLLLAAVVLIAVALVPLSWQSLLAARVNPVRWLKEE